MTGRSCSRLHGQLSLESTQLSVVVVDGLRSSGLAIDPTGASDGGCVYGNVLGAHQTLVEFRLLQLFELVFELVLSAQ